MVAAATFNVNVLTVTVEISSLSVNLLTITVLTPFIIVIPTLSVHVKSNAYCSRLTISVVIAKFTVTHEH